MALIHVILLFLIDQNKTRKATETQDADCVEWFAQVFGQIVYNGLPKFLGRLLYAYLLPLLGADELGG